MKTTLPNGIVIDDQGAWAASATRYAKTKGFDNIIVYLATEPNGRQEYVIVHANQPVYASQNFEAIGAHIDILALDRDLPH